MVTRERRPLTLIPHALLHPPLISSPEACHLSVEEMDPERMNAPSFNVVHAEAKLARPSTSKAWQALCLVLCIVVATGSDSLDQRAREARPKPGRLPPAAGSKMKNGDRSC